MAGILDEDLLGVEGLKNVHHIRCPFSRLGYFTSACAIVEKMVTLIDTGTPTSPEEAILPYLKLLGKGPTDISRIVLTHAHFDHCGGIAPLKQKSNAKVAVHRLDEPLLRDPLLLNRELNSRFPEIYPLSLKPEYEPTEADLVLNDGEEICLEDRVLKAVLTPGHSEGSIVLLDVKARLCVSGDSIQGRGERRPLLFFSSTNYADSVRRLMKEQIETLILGHPMPPFNKGVLHGDEVRIFLQESLKAIEELSEKVLRVTEESGKAISLKEIASRIPEVQQVTIGCILESFSR